MVQRTLEQKPKIFNKKTQLPLLIDTVSVNRGSGTWKLSYLLYALKPRANGRNIVDQQQPTLK